MVSTRSTAPISTSNNSNKISVKDATQKKPVNKKKKTQKKSLSHKIDDPQKVMEDLNNSEASFDDEEPPKKKKNKRQPNPTITADPPNINERKAKNTDAAASAATAAVAAAVASVTGTSGGVPVNSTTIVAAKAGGEDVVDHPSVDAGSSVTLVNAPTTTTTITTKDKKAKGFLDITGIPVLPDQSFAISFYDDGSNKLIIDPSDPLGMACCHCGKVIESFGNVAHHVSDTYPRENDTPDGKRGKLSKINNVHTGTCAHACDSAKINIIQKRAEWESNNTPNKPLFTLTMEELRVIVFKHKNIADDSTPPAISQEGKTTAV